MRFFILILVLSFGHHLWSQDKYELSFASDTYRLIKKNPTRKFKDSIQAKSYVQKLKFFAIKKGYLLASVDSLHYLPNKLIAHLHVGEQFKRAFLELPEENMDFLRRKARLSEKEMHRTLFRPGEISRLLKKIQEAYENNGYPFCRVTLENSEIRGLDLFARIRVEEQHLLRFSAIHLVGHPLLSEKLVASYTQIKVGALFDQSKVNLISSKIKQLGFVEEAKPAELLFTRQGVEVFLYLKARPVSLINGIIGFQPDPISSKVTLTGEFRLKLVNVLRKAETIDFNWRSIRAQTQSLKALVILPNLFQTPFGVNTQFQLYKRDSSFLEMKATLGIQYALNQGNYLKFFYRRNASSVLSGGANNPTLSNLKSVESNSYGLAFNKQSLNYIPNPSRGIRLYVEANLGKRIVKDSTTSQPNTIFSSELQFEIFYPLAKRHVIRLANATEVYLAPSYFQNESFRFGGQVSLRGFREEEINASSRTVGTIEYRFLLDQNSHLFAFFDQAWYENKAALNFVTDTPYGFGAGFTFGTKIGNFSISYALGKQFDNPILLSDGKIHFGYISYF